MNAIETEYNGYRFRSRLEARWAVFFDTGNIKFEYEPEGIKDEDNMYLPDFYLPEHELYVEVKPDRPNAKEELKKPLQCVLHNQIQRLLILQDIPNWSEIECWWYPFAYYDNGTQGLSIAKCTMSPCSDNSISIFTNLSAGYLSEKRMFSINCMAMKDISFSPIHDEELDYKEKNPFRWSETLAHDDDRNLLHKAYNAARQARFEHINK